MLAGGGSAVAGEPVPFVLPAQGAPVQLRFHSNAGSPGFRGVELEAFGDVLLGPAVPGAGACAGFQVRPVDIPASSSPVVLPLGRRQGEGWQYAAFDLTAAWGPRVSRHVRQLLFVEPDLFVIHDEMRTRDPVEWEFCLASPGPLQTEAVSGNFVVERSRAGLTGHFLTDPIRSLTPWTAGGAGLSSRTSRPLDEIRSILVLLPHAAGCKRSSGFRLLRSESAIGARIHRDGLPTLVAFNLGRSEEAELAGLRFRGSIAVEVFRPKPRVRTSDR